MAKKTNIPDELLNMDEKQVSLSDIFLDPNNPRLDSPIRRNVADNRIREEEIQEECLKMMRSVGIEDLTASIQTSGFWVVDRVVLRPLTKGQYAVVEGNRRIAALKTLVMAHTKGEITIPQSIYKGIKKFTALIYNGDSKEIAWIIQGFRHTPGIKIWEKYPQAKFFAQYSHMSKKTLADISKIFCGIKPRDIMLLIRSYYAFEDAKKDEDYGDDLTSDRFGHFEEIIMRTTLKEWMGWDEPKKMFSKKKNLKSYLSWIVAEKGEKPLIDISAIVRKTLPELVKPEHKKLLAKFENRDLTIGECNLKIAKEEDRRVPIDVDDIMAEIEGINNLISTLPLPQLQGDKTADGKIKKKKLQNLLEILLGIVKQQLKNLTIK